MNRIKNFFEPSPEPEQPDDYYEVESFCDTYVVSRDTAMEIERTLDRVPRPPWVAFRDLTGAWHRILVAHVIRVSECTAAQRAAYRAFWRARRLEAKADRRPWEDDN